MSDITVELEDIVFKGKRYLIEAVVRMPTKHVVLGQIFRYDVERQDWFLMPSKQRMAFLRHFRIDAQDAVLATLKTG